jgi:hypothetical protein
LEKKNKLSSCVTQQKHFMLDDEKNNLKKITVPLFTEKQGHEWKE